MKLRLLRGMFVERDLTNGTDLCFTHFDQLKLKLKYELFEHAGEESGSRN